MSRGPGVILASLVAGVLVGLALHRLGAGGSGHWLLTWILEPLGRMWLGALLMVVLPLVLSTLPLGLADLGGGARLRRIGLTTLACFVALTALSAGLGLALSNALRPGAGLDPAAARELIAAYRTQADEAAGRAAFGPDTLVRLVPRNPVRSAADGDILAVVVFALILGLALSATPKERARPLATLLRSVADVTLACIGLVMRLAPLGVFCLVAGVAARFGTGLLGRLVWYVLTVLGGLLLFQALVYPLALWLVARRSPWPFLRAGLPVALTAFSTSSSNATLPTTLRVAEQELGIPAPIARFVLPLGATLNMNGTALFEGATVLFLAQVFGVELTLGAQAIVVGLAVITAIGAAGVPGGSIPLLMGVLASVGVPPEGIAIVLGVDRILDMARTVLNVSGDLVTAGVVARVEAARATSGITTTPAGHLEMTPAAAAGEVAR